MDPLHLHPPPREARTTPAVESALAPSAFDAMEALGAMSSGVVVVAPDWTILYANAAWDGMLGARAERCVGADLWEIFPVLHAAPDACGIFATYVDGIARECRVSHGEHTYALRVARIGAGDAQGPLVLEVRDVSPSARLEREHVAEVSTRVQRERELEERSAENDALRELARQMAELPDAIAFLRRLCETAMTACGASGVAVAQLEGHDLVVLAAAGVDSPPVGVVVPLAEPLAERFAAARTLTSRRDYAADEHPIARHAPDGVIAEVLSAPLLEHDALVGVLSVWRGRGAAPFTAGERERLRVIADHAAVAMHKARLLEAAEAANLAKTFFLATVSHELRTPLAAITGYGELIADDIFGPLSDQQRDAVERMRSATHQLAVQVDEILTYAELEAGNINVRSAELQMLELMDGVVQVIDPMARQKGLDLRVVIPRDAPTLLTDPEKVRQIVLNIAGNAVKFTERGEIELRLSARGNEVRIAVRDTGIGIARDDLQRLFHPFTQLDAGLTRRHGGTGLGLYISHRLAELLGGRIEVESEAGKGSTFTVVLPVRGQR